MFEENLEARPNNLLFIGMIFILYNCYIIDFNFDIHIHIFSQITNVVPTAQFDDDRVAE